MFSLPHRKKYFQHKHAIHSTFSQSILLRDCDVESVEKGIVIKMKRSIILATTQWVQGKT